MKVSVIIPCYNRIRFTKFCVPMAIRNAGMEATWYLVDDGSSDGTAEFLQGVKAAHPELKINVIIHEENQGTWKVHNEVYKMMAESDSEIFVNCDNDLLVPLNWLRDLAAAMENAPWVSGGAPLIANDVNITKFLTKEKPLSDLPSSDWISVTGCGGTLIAYRREIFDAGIYCGKPAKTWVYEDSIHHKAIQQHGFQLAIFTGVQAWMVERLVWDDQEIEKLRNRHVVISGNMDDFDRSLKWKRDSIPW